LNRGEIEQFQTAIEAEWFGNIAPFWLEKAPDRRNGGFYGLIYDDLRVVETAEKGIILNSRILWTFSRAFTIYKKNEYRKTAERAFEYLSENFFDQDRGGVFWTVDYRGAPHDTKKRTYAQAFTVYALAEYFLATSERTALEKANGLFETIETVCRDEKYDGYLETFERNWIPAEDQRLSASDRDDAKSMNTHLHLLEAYANLYRAGRDETVGERLRFLIRLFLDKIIDPERFTLRMFFEENWTPTTAITSFGHDIETSWLLTEAAQISGAAELIERTRDVCVGMAKAVLRTGLAADGSLLYEAEGGKIINHDRDWWVQTEAVVGFFNAYELSGDERFLKASMANWDYLVENFVDQTNGEWFWKIRADGRRDPEKPKLSQWKCPYHNGRLCFEMKHRLKKPAAVFPGPAQNF
jgi:cellobiose epimerase